VLGERITGVRASQALHDSPARLVAPAGATGHELARIQRLIEQDYRLPPKLLELNRGHELVASLARLVEQQPDGALTVALIEQLYDNALLLEGLHANPAGRVGRIQTLMEAAARALS
jgi:molecular chaperone HtpG